VSPQLKRVETMPREATGELRKLADGYAALITIEGRTRKEFRLRTCATPAEATERCRALAQTAARLRRSGHAAEIEQLVAIGAKARAGRPWEAVCAAVDALCAGQTLEKTSRPPTLAEWGRQWVTGELAKKYPDHVRPKRSADRDEELLRLYVLPHTTDVLVDEFTLEHAEFVMANLPETVARSRRQIAQVMSRLMTLAVYPGKWIKASPIPRGWLPSPPIAKAKECLYPDEDALLLAGRSVELGKLGPLADVPLLRRLAYGFLAREGMRTDEMASLRWRDVDLKRGRVNLNKDKTDDPRDWDLRPDVVEVLKRWKSTYQPNAEPVDYVFAENGVPLNVEHLAVQARNDLQRVGIRRPELFESTDTRQRFRAHDLRATFVTIALATGKTETWVSDRTGHDGHTMIDKYRRKARTWNLGELGPLHTLIPELSEAEPSARIATRIPHKLTARVAKLADAADLGSAAERHKGSTPFPCTFINLGPPLV
jgi:integrase